MQVRAIETLKDSVARVEAVARVALNARRAKRRDLHRGDALVRPDEWTQTDVVDVRLISPAPNLPSRLVVHLGSAAVPARARALGDRAARLHLDHSFPLHVGDRAVLRDPGACSVIGGALVLDVMPPELGRRGAARLRAGELAVMPAEAQLADEVARRIVVSRASLRRAGIRLPDAVPAEIVTVADWLIDPRHWASRQVSLIEAVGAWGAEHRLQPGLPRARAARLLGLPDVRLLDALVTRTAGLVGDADGIHSEGVRASLPDDVRGALDALLARLAVRPFDAPEAPDLTRAGLTERHLAAAAKDGELTRITAGIYLLPDALARAAHTLAALAQPFTASEARRALDAPRRAALPLLELMDRSRLTRRIDEQHRTVLRS